MGTVPQPYLSGSEGHFAVLAFTQLSELVEDGGQFLRQGRVWATEFILWGTKQNLSGFCLPEETCQHSSSARDVAALINQTASQASEDTCDSLLHMPCPFPPCTSIHSFIHSPKTCPKHLVRKKPTSKAVPASLLMANNYGGCLLCARKQLDP